MIEEISPHDFNDFKLPFEPYLFPYEDSKIFLRKDDARHITVVQNFSYENINFSAKEFFMDWYYYGFPKNLMKNSSETYSNIWRNHVEINGKNYPIFYGKDYRDRFAASISSGGVTVELRSNSDFSEMLNDIFRNFKIRNSDKRFYELSHYIKRDSWRWFEEERIGRMSWSPMNNVRIGDYYGDSHGNFNNIHEIEIYRNIYGDYLWLDYALKNTGLKNLYYRFNGHGNLFSEITRINDWNVFLASEFGPAILRYENEKKVFVVSLPFVEFGDVWKYMDIIEKLNLMSRFP